MHEPLAWYSKSTCSSSKTILLGLFFACLVCLVFKLISARATVVKRVVSFRKKVKKTNFKNSQTEKVLKRELARGES